MRTLSAMGGSTKDHLLWQAGSLGLSCEAASREALHTEKPCSTGCVPTTWVMHLHKTTIAEAVPVGAVGEVFLFGDKGGVAAASPKASPKDYHFGAIRPR